MFISIFIEMNSLIETVSDYSKRKKEKEKKVFFFSKIENVESLTVVFIQSPQFCIKIYPQEPTQCNSKPVWDNLARYPYPCLMN